MSLSWLKMTAIVACVGLLSACSGGGSAKHTTAQQDANQNLNNKNIVFTVVDLSLIADANLRQCIEEIGAKETIHQNLNCSRRGITSLRGIEQFQDLRMLDLSHNQLSNIDELSQLSRLSSLYINDNQIYDLSALEKLSALTKLVANNNQIQSIDALENSKVRQLYLNNNQISNLAVINSLASLENFTAENNRASIPNSLPKTLKTYSL